MRVFVYEFVTGGGCWHLPGTPSLLGSLLSEGTAMLDAVVTDFCRQPDVQVVTLRDARLSTLNLQCDEIIETRFVSNASDELAAFQQAAGNCDASLVVAPEFDNLLLQRVKVAAAIGPLLSPHQEFVAVTADKLATVQRLELAGVHVPRTKLMSDEAASEFSYPLIVKPRDGAGSMGVCRIEESGELRSHVTNQDSEQLIQEFCPGIPASIAFICTPSQNIDLPVCQQILSADGFEYRGGRVLRDEGLQRRARRLGLAALAALPKTIGYVGLDIVLSPDRASELDTVIEVNPRLTTSYVGLRSAIDENIAELMLAAQLGRRVDAVAAKTAVDFDAQGRVSKVN